MRVEHLVFTRTRSDFGRYPARRFNLVITFSDIGVIYLIEHVTALPYLVRTNVSGGDTPRPPRPLPLKSPLYGCSLKGGPENFFLRIVWILRICTIPDFAVRAAP